jgi:cytochrome c553
MVVFRSAKERRALFRGAKGDKVWKLKNMSKSFSIVFICLAAPAFAPAARADSKLAESADTQHLASFFGTYCAACHGEKKPEGDLSLTNIDDAKWTDFKFALDILGQLEERTMPPDDAEKRLDDEHRAAAIEHLKTHLESLTPEPGGGVLVRLNRTEYENTINDVFGTTLKLADLLPPDSDPEEGFANVGERLFISPGSVEHYMNLGIKLSEQLIRSQPVPINETFSAGNRAILPKVKAATNVKKLLTSLEGFKGQPVSYVVTFDVPETGYYDVQLQDVFFSRMPSYKQPLMRDQVDIPLSKAKFFIGTNGTTGETKPELIAKGKEAVDASEPYRLFVKKGEKIMLHHGETFWQTTDGTFVPVKVSKTKPTAEDLTKLVTVPINGRQRPVAYGVWSNGLTISGPMYDIWPPKEQSAYQYFTSRDNNIDTVRATVSVLADRLYRRPTTEQDRQQLNEIATLAFEKTGNIYDAVQASLGAMLCSPNFLYKYSSNTEQLDDYAIASRLSYFLWNTLPDEKLLELAAQRKVRDQHVRREQTLRMLKDPRSNRFAYDFTHQWLDLHKLPAIAPNIHLFPAEQFTPELHQEMELEPIEFFKIVLKENLSIENFIDSDFIVATPRLESLYGLRPPRKGGGKGSVLGTFTKIPLKKRRADAGGLVTQRGFLLMTSDGEMTNPIYRGVWVLKNLYGKKMILDSAPEAIPTDVNTSIRAKLADHRKTTNCAICHNHIDPLGLAMEGLDVMGRKRSHYIEIKERKTVEEYEKKGKILEREVFTYDFVEHDLIDDIETYSDGREVNGFDGIKTLLMADKDKVAKALIGKLFTYALGRKHEFHDGEAINHIYSEIASSGGRLQDLIVELVASDSFAIR